MIILCSHYHYHWLDDDAVTQSFGKLDKMGQVVSGGNRMQTQVCLIPEPNRFPLPGTAAQGSSGRKADIQGSNSL